MVLFLGFLTSCATDSDTDPTRVIAKATIGEICDGEDNDGDATIDEDCAQCDRVVTRARVWWSTRDCVIDGDATGTALVPVTVGATINLTTGSAVETYLSTVPAGAVAQLGQQIVVAKLNMRVFFLDDLPYDDWDADGDNETVGELLTTAEALYSSGSPVERNRMRTLLVTLNADGMAFPLWFDPICRAEPEVCDGWDDDGDGVVDDNCACDPAAYTYSYADDIQPIWDGNCLGCHTDYPAYGYYAPWGLDLNAGVSYDLLVNVAAGGLPSMDRVEPGDATGSYVVHKLRGTHLTVGGDGEQMPYGGPYLDEATIGIVETWIAEGAPDN